MNDKIFSARVVKRASGISTTAAMLAVLSAGLGLPAYHIYRDAAGPRVPDIDDVDSMRAEAQALRKALKKRRQHGSWL